jgi:hypothetical protein
MLGNAFSTSAFNYDSAAFTRTRENLQIFVMDHIQMAHDDTEIWDKDIVASYTSVFGTKPEIAVGKFLGMFVDCMFKARRGFHLDYAQNRSCFYGFAFRESNVMPSAKRHTRTARQYPKKADVLDVLGDYVEPRLDSMVLVSRLKKLYEAADGKADKAPFSEALQSLLDRDEGLSIVKKPGKHTGKLRDYLAGLVLTEAGRSLLDEGK